ncbi:MAG: hypothetical protein PHE51_06655 [Eubacteriales bacterium]|nr:hypothetical protein [Eubacteriales bacterium]
MNNLKTYENGRIKIHRLSNILKNANNRITVESIIGNDTYNDKILDFPANDIGNARRFLLYSGKHVVYDKSKLMLAFWNGKYFDYDSEDDIMKLAIAVMDIYFLF